MCRTISFAMLLCVFACSSRDGNEAKGTAAAEKASPSDASRLAATIGKSKMTFCCRSGMGSSGEDCEPIDDAPDAVNACIQAEKFTLHCGGEHVVDGRNISCAPEEPKG